MAVSPRHKQSIFPFNLSLEQAASHLRISSASALETKPCHDSTEPPVPLQPDSQTGILSTAQPRRRRKGRKSMLRRSGQNGTIVVQSGFYRVRWRIDVEGQNERQNMNVKVAPVVLDKEGKPKPASPEVRRMAREIVERSGANSEQRFNRIVLGEATFRDQAKVYLSWAVTRGREPVKDASSIQAALNKWILPAIGDMPLASVNNITVKPLVDKMKKSLSARSVNTYVGYIQQIVGSLKDGETGEPIHRRKWDSSVMDLPLVNSKQQRRPALKAKAVNQLVKESEGEEQALYVLEGATGLRISEALALEARHFINGGRTIEIQQQVDRDTPRIVSYLKTDAAYRQVDLSTEVAEYLLAFINGREGLLFKTRNGTPYLHNSLESRWLTERPKAMGLDEPGMGWHAFRRFRKTWLRGKRCQEDINNLWMGHKPKTMSELYSRMDEELEQRLQEAEIVGVGFEIPYVAPKCSKIPVELEVEVAA
jgi:integrase